MVHFYKESSSGTLVKWSAILDKPQLVKNIESAKNKLIINYEDGTIEEIEVSTTGSGGGGNQIGIKSEIIFDGKASSVGDYELSNSIDIFKMIMICFSCDNNTTKENTLKGTNIIPLVDINFGDTLQHLQAHRIVLVENGFINFGFKHSKILSIGRITKTQYNTSVQITKVIGIY